jgi:hypothetical protein
MSLRSLSAARRSPPPARSPRAAPRAACSRRRVAAECCEAKAKAAAGSGGGGGGRRRRRAEGGGSCSVMAGLPPGCPRELAGTAAVIKLIEPAAVTIYIHIYSETAAVIKLIEPAAVTILAGPLHSVHCCCTAAELLPLHCCYNAAAAHRPAGRGAGEVGAGSRGPGGGLKQPYPVRVVEGHGCTICSGAKSA